MAQGTIKAGKKSTAPTVKGSGGRKTVLGPKKGARTIAPRKAGLVRNAKMTKVCTPIAFCYSTSTLYWIEFDTAHVWRSWLI
jgi:hypothetical protein